MRSIASWGAAATVVALGAAIAVAQDHLSFWEALEEASSRAGDLVAAEITLHEDADPPRFEVLFLTEVGTDSFEIDADDGRLIQRERVDLGPRFPQNLRRLLGESDVTLEDAIELAEDHAEGPLRRVAFQIFRGELVIEAQAVEEGERIGFVLDPDSGREIVGEPRLRPVLRSARRRR